MLLPFSKTGLKVDGLVGDVNEVLKFPLHEAVLLEAGGGWWSPLALIPNPFIWMLFILGNLCIVICGGAPEDAATSSPEFSSCLVSEAAGSVAWPFEDDAGVAGMKNFAFAGIGGLGDGMEDEWNIVWEFPRPWLKVSTYLSQKRGKHYNDKYVHNLQWNTNKTANNYNW